MYVNIKLSVPQLHPVHVGDLVKNVLMELVEKTVAIAQIHVKKGKEIVTLTMIVSAI